MIDPDFVAGMQREDRRWAETQEKVRAIHAGAMVLLGAKLSLPGATITEKDGAEAVMASRGTYLLAEDAVMGPPNTGKPNVG